MRFFAFTTTSTLLLLATANLGSAWTQQMNPTSTTSVAASNAKLSATASTRRDVLFGMASTTVSSIFLWMENAKPARAAETLANGVSYEIMKSGSGPKPQVGELVAIRFAAYCGDTKIDDIFDTPEPYYTRIGSGGLLKGVEETLPLMQVGDRWKLTIPGDLAFGPKGRPASAGKPRIPANSIIVFDVEMVGLPGRETELIELYNDL